MLQRILGLTGVLLMSASPALAYQVGDNVDPEILARLQVDNDKVTVVDFFAAWCVSCHKEIPLISKVEQQANPDKVAIVGVDVDQELSEAQAFQAELKAKQALSFPVVNDTDQQIVAKFGPLGMPALYYLKGGKVIGQHLGAVADIDQVLTQELRELGGEDAVR